LLLRPDRVDCLLDADRLPQQHPKRVAETKHVEFHVEREEIDFRAGHDPVDAGESVPMLYINERAARE
jgi:hypothetical protein